MPTIGFEIAPKACLDRARRRPSRPRRRPLFPLLEESARRKEKRRKRSGGRPCLAMVLAHSNDWFATREIRGTIVTGVAAPRGSGGVDRGRRGSGSGPRWPKAPLGQE